MRIIQTIAGVRMDHGGPSRSVPALCDALVLAGADVHLITGVPENNSITHNFPKESTQIHKVRESKYLRHGTASGFSRQLRALARNATKPTLVHDHGVWLPSNHAIAREARRLGLPRVVSPRGMLSNWSMNRRRLMKRCMWHLYQRRDLRNASAFVATSELEAEDIRKLGFTQPTAVIPNGINFPAALPERQNLATQQILFLSRIHPKKGVLELVEAFCKANLPALWQLVIAGPDEGGHQSAVERKIHELGIAHRVVFPGAVDDAAKWQLYVDSDLFVLPSFTENFGIVIAEAMAAGLPVITTTGTPWQCLQSEKMGWWIAPEIPAITSALVEAQQLTIDERSAMGARASRYARKHFSWQEIGKRVLDFYVQLQAERAG